LNDFNGFNVLAIVLEVDKSLVTKNGALLSVWGSTNAIRDKVDVYEAYAMYGCRTVVCDCDAGRMRLRRRRYDADGDANAAPRDEHVPPSSGDRGRPD
jgi:hypothetical protein